MKATVTDLEFSFSDDAYKRSNDEFVAEINAGISSKSELLDCLAKALDVPNDLGRNWDALFDILRDLSWIDHKRVTIVHNDLPNLPANDLRVYLDVLRDSLCDWRPGETHSLSVLFPVSARDRIVRALGTKAR